MSEKQISRFLSKIKKSATGCWEWTGAITENGYGRVCLTYEKERRWYTAHRVMYWITKGNPDSLNVCHHCDNRKCVNPEHLFLASQSDNILDAVKKGRWTQQRTKFAANDIKAIRESAEPVKTIAEQFGTTASYIYQIRNGDRWKNAY